MAFASNAFCMPPKTTTHTTANQRNDLSMQYYLVKNGTPTGPFLLEQLRAMLADGSASIADLCWAEGMPTWVPLAQVLGIPLPESGFAVARGYAGFGRRFAAVVIDALILMIPSNMIMRLGNAPQPQFENAKSLPELMKMISIYSQQTASLQMVCLVLTWLYFAFMESSSRQGTLGKNALGLIVTNLNGGRVSFLQATGRFLGKNFLSFGLTMGFGCLTIFFTQKKQALHDLIARTLVLRK